METFLKQVAADLYRKLHGDFTKVAVVFPNKRASLFFNEYLAQESDRPVWSPAYVSISELFRQSSQWVTGDSIKLVCDLYKVFREVTGSKESLDDFYFWGEMLISDFDDADKNLVDTKALFSNLKDLNKLTAEYDFLEEGQKEALSQFFRNFSIEQVTELKRRFISLWDVLGDIYTQYKERLREQGIAYEGMLYREVTEMMDVQKFPYDTYVFVGFNVLNKVEQTLFSKLHAAGKALFYWDYDTFYLDKHPHEAGEFIRRNLKNFPSELPPALFDHLNHPKEITFIESPTENGQARYLPQWIRENLTENEKETAVVLCNEAMLQPVLHSLPENVRHINITMGFPLSQTPAYSFVKTLLELHISGYNSRSGRYQFAEVISVLKHPYTQLLSEAATPLEKELTEKNRFYPLPSELERDEALSLLFKPCTHNEELCKRLADILKQVAQLYRKQAASTSDALDQLYREALFKSFTMVNRFHALLESKDLDVQPATFHRLLVRVMSTASIPFHGEPAIGMQVMGVLETRNLDFCHVILLSVNEGQLPKAGGDSSFIPYNLRAAYELPTPEHHEGVYAYYFYRLIQRAKTVHMLYCSHADDKSTGEPSRYIYQLDYESGFDVRKVEVGVDVNLAETAPIEVPKDEGVMARLERFVDAQSPATLSPTAFFRYVACPLRFYFHSIARLEADDEISEEVDAPMFGTILHAAVQMLYARIAGEAHPGETLRAMIRTGEVAQAVEAAINENYLQDKHATAEDYSGNLLLVKDIVIRYLRGGVMPYDAAHDAFAVSGLEEPVAYPFRFRAGGRDLEMKFAGIADRIDTLDDGALRVVDYKTGAPHLEFDGVESLFTGTGKQRLSNILQTLLYAMMLHRSRGCDVEPALYYVRNMNRPGYSPQLDDKQTGVKGARYTLYRERFEELLRAQLAELYDTSVPFRQCEDADTCKYCDFNVICKR